MIHHLLIIFGLISLKLDDYVKFVSLGLLLRLNPWLKNPVFCATLNPIFWNFRMGCLFFSFVSFWESDFMMLPLKSYSCFRDISDSDSSDSKSSKTEIWAWSIEEINYENELIEWCCTLTKLFLRLSINKILTPATLTLCFVFLFFRFIAIWAKSATHSTCIRCIFSL